MSRLARIINQGFAKIKLGLDDVNLQKKMANDHAHLWKEFNFYNSNKAKGNFDTTYNETPLLQKNEIETRILRVLYESELVDINRFQFQKDFRKDYNLDSLDLTVLLTSIETQFTTVFEDRIFQSVSSMQEIVTILAKDFKII